MEHGGWWAAKTAADITGTVSIEFGDRCYLKALDNGYTLSSIFNALSLKTLFNFRLFTLGAPHNAGDGPDPEEIFTAFPVNDRKVSFKSGYGKYLKIEKDGMVTGRSEAVGSMEQWEPVFEVHADVILSYNFFLS